MNDKLIIIEARIMFEWDFCAMCIVKLYQRQTADEKDSRSSQHINGIGFNKVDAVYLTPVAVDIILYRIIKQNVQEISTKLMKKYSKQLSAILTEEEVET